MKNFTITLAVALAVLVSGAGRVFAAEGWKPGNVRVLKVTGDVTLHIEKTKTTEPLKEGTFVRQDQIIKTGGSSSTVLLFSNGTTVTVQPNSEFHFNKFLQFPFDSSEINYKGLKEEPSKSQTEIEITKGSFIADVAKLAKGSSFNIETPLGVAGIRGTLIQVTVNTTAGGQISVTINLPQGVSDFSATNGRQITLANGQTVTVTSDPVTGVMSITGVSPLNAQTIQQVQQLAEEVAALIPAEQAFEGVQAGSPEQLGDGTVDDAGGFGGDQGAGDVGTSLPSTGGGGGSSGGGVVPTPTPPKPISP